MNHDPAIRWRYPIAEIPPDLDTKRIDFKLIDHAIPHEFTKCSLSNMCTKYVTR